jgi:hypothetical protein
MHSGRFHLSMWGPHQNESHDTKYRVDCSGRKKSLIADAMKHGLDLDTLDKRFGSDVNPVTAPGPAGSCSATDGAEGDKTASLIDFTNMDSVTKWKTYFDDCRRVKKAYGEAQKSLQEYEKEDHIGNNVGPLPIWAYKMDPLHILLADYQCECPIYPVRVYQGTNQSEQPDCVRTC